MTNLALIDDATKLINHGDQSIASVNFIDKIFGDNGRGKIDTGIDFYEKAANKYKQAHQWILAGDIYMKCGNKTRELLHGVSTLNYYKNAVECYIQSDAVKKLKTCYDFVLAEYLSSGKFYEAGKLAESIGDYLNKINIGGSLNEYLHAIDYYDTITNKAQSNNAVLACVNKVVNIYIDMKQYKLAINYFEMMLTIYKSHPLSKYKLGDTLLDLCICIAATNDLVELKKTYDKYSKLNDFAFRDSSQDKAIKTLIYCMENHDSAPINLFDYSNNWRGTALAQCVSEIDKSDIEDFR